MRRRWITCLFFAGVGAVSSGCGGDPRTDIGEVSTAIVGGTADSTHDAVVYLGLSGGACSGTLFLVEPTESVGYVLTAAHCVSNGLVPYYALIGPDSAAPKSFYYALDALADSRYATDLTYDFAVVRIVGVDADTPTIPLLESFGKAPVVGDDGLVVGYGLTTANDHTTVALERRQLPMSVVDVSPQTLVLSGLGSTCFGDSGGPFLVERNGVERVAAVTSRGVDSSCYLEDDDTLVQPSFGDQLAAFVEAPVPESCTRCRDTMVSGKQPCADLRARCNSEAGCYSLRDCLSGCNGELSCQRSCVRPAPSSDPGTKLFFEESACDCAPCANACPDPNGFCARLPELETPPAVVATPTIAAGASGGCAVNRGSERPGPESGLWVGFVVWVVARRNARRRRSGTVVPRRTR
jgi:hypothetical protein